MKRIQNDTQVYDIYCDCKRLIGTLQYLYGLQRKKDKELIEENDLLFAVQMALQAKVIELSGRNIMQGYSETMRKEIDLLLCMKVCRKKSIMMFTKDKFTMMGKKDGVVIMKKARGTKINA